MNAEWKAKVGEGTAVNWPTGAGGKGNEGVVGVRAAAAELDRLRRVRVRQAEQDDAHAAEEQGRQLRRRPTTTNFKAAAAGADWSKTFYQILTDQPGKDAWPITGATFILMYKAQDKPANAANALKFFDWAYANGDKMADDLEYVPLPASVKDLVRKQWAANIKDAAGKPSPGSKLNARLLRRGHEMSATLPAPPYRRSAGAEIQADMNGRPPAAASRACPGPTRCSRFSRMAPRG